MDIFDWAKSPSCGGVPIDDLRNIALELGIDITGMKKVDICEHIYNKINQKINQVGSGKEERLWQTYGEALIERFKKDRTAPKKMDTNALVTLPDELIAGDPTKSKYLEWIIQSYLRGGIKLFEDIPSKVPEAINDWTYLKDKKILKKDATPWSDETNILNYCGLDKCNVTKKDKKEYSMMGLYDVLKKYQDILDQRVSASAKKISPADGELVYEDEQIKVFHPKTEAGACYYGQGTKWCTAATKAENMFQEYNKDGPMYSIIPKKPEHVGEKYQIHIATKSFKDEMDDDIKLSKLLKKYPGLKSFKPIAEYLAFKKLIEQDLTIPLIQKYLDKGFDISHFLGEMDERPDDPNEEEYKIKSILSEAIRQSADVDPDTSVVQFLLAHGADPNPGLEVALEALHFPWVSYGRTYTQMLLPHIKKAKLVMMDSLLTLLEDENLPILDHLMKNGLDLNNKLYIDDGSQEYPLSYIYERPSKNDDDPVQNSPTGNMPARAQKFKFQKLFERGYNPNLSSSGQAVIYDVLDNTPNGGDPDLNELLKLLIHYGADIYEKEGDKSSRTPMEYAKEIGLEDLFLEAYSSRNLN